MKVAPEIFVTDVLVVGAGPAGISAATAAAISGCSVHLLDDNPAPGGQIWRSSFTAEHRAPSNRYTPRAKALRGLEKNGVVFHPATRVFAESAPCELEALVNDVKVVHFRYQKLIIATGARELFLPFMQWTVPGVFGAGGLQALVRGGYDIAGKRVAIVGSGPLLLAVAAHLREAGARIALLSEQAPIAAMVRFAAHLTTRPAKLLQGVGYAAALRGVPVRLGWWPVEAICRPQGGLRGVRITNGRKSVIIECDVLASGFHLVPNTELAELLGCALTRGSAGKRVTVDVHQRTSRAGVFCAGEPTGIAGLDAAQVQGEIAGLTAAGRSSDHLLSRAASERTFGEWLSEAFALRQELRYLSGPETIVCRCEDVSYSSLQNCSGWTNAKLQTRCGMGPCQGRICGPAVQWLFGWEPTSVRPPIFPVPFHSLTSMSKCSYEEPL